MKRVKSFFFFTLRIIGPFINLDFGSFFFLIVITELLLNRKVSLFILNLRLRDLQTSPRQISPFMLYLYLNPLYSIRGGSTIFAEPFIKNPSSVLLRLNPLYKWKIFIHRTFVLSDTNNQDSFCNNYTDLLRINKNCTCNTGYEPMIRLLRDPLIKNSNSKALYKSKPRKSQDLYNRPVRYDFRLKSAFRKIF